MALRARKISGAFEKQAAGPRFPLWQNRCHSNFTCSDVSLAQLNSYSPFWEKHQAMEGIQDKDYNFLGNDKFPNTRDYFMSENLRVDI